jgi:hypothetical protein
MLPLIINQSESSASESPNRTITLVLETETRLGEAGNTDFHCPCHLSW